MPPAVSPSRASAAYSPHRSDRTSSARRSEGRSISASQTPAPAREVHLRPGVPRPAVCSSATISVPAGADAAIACATSRVELTDSRSSTRGRSSSDSSSAADRPSNRTDARSAKEGKIEHERERDPVPPEQREVAALQVSEERLDGDDRRDEADDEPDAEDAEVAAERFTALEQL